MRQQYPNEEEETSKYNEGLLQMQRLNALWINAEVYANRGLLLKWQFALDSIWRELYADVKRHPDSIQIQKFDIEIRENISKSKNKKQLYWSLNKRHEFLKEVQDGAGKGSVYESKTKEDFA